MLKENYYKPTFKSSALLQVCVIEYVAPCHNYENENAFTGNVLFRNVKQSKKIFNRKCQITPKL